MRLMKPRRLALVALLVGAMLALVGWGRGSEEEAIAEAIRTSGTTSKVSNCTKLETKRFVDQLSSRKGPAALEKCEEEARNHEGVARSVKVSHVVVKGDAATAVVAVHGGGFDRQTLAVSLVRRGNWKLDQFTGFIVYDGNVFAARFEKEAREHPGLLPPATVKCIAKKIRTASKHLADEFFLSGSDGPTNHLIEQCEA
jgi:hypothetical protein